MKRIACEVIGCEFRLVICFTSANLDYLFPRSPFTHLQLSWAMSPSVKRLVESFPCHLCYMKLYPVSNPCALASYFLIYLFFCRCSFQLILSLLKVVTTIYSLPCLT